MVKNVIRKVSPSTSGLELNHKKFQQECLPYFLSWLKIGENPILLPSQK